MQKNTPHTAKRTDRDFTDFTDFADTLEGVADCKERDISMIDLNGPIITFYKNCKQHGVVFAIDDAGKLTVTLPDELKANTFFQDEIVKRVAWLKELAEMDGLMNRPLSPTDADRQRYLAAKYGCDLVWTRIPLNPEHPDADKEGAAADLDQQDLAAQLSMDMVAL